MLVTFTGGAGAFFRFVRVASFFTSAAAARSVGPIDVDNGGAIDFLHR